MKTPTTGYYSVIQFTPDAEDEKLATLIATSGH